MQLEEHRAEASINTDYRIPYRTRGRDSQKPLSPVHSRELRASMVIGEFGDRHASRVMAEFVRTL